jgi:S1-C subfamily serine protease
MKCPKCGHEQPDAATCKSCGVIIKKYEAWLQKAESLNQPDVAVSRENKPGFPLIMVVVGVVITAVALYVLLPGKSDQATDANKPIRANIAESSTNTETSSYAGTDYVSQLKQTAPAANAIERARNATVFIKTKWGTGSGFFVTENCLIITNKHVVKVSEQKIANTEAEVESWKTKLERARKDIELRKKDFQRRCKGCSKEQYYLFVGQHEEKLAEMESRLDEIDVAVTDVKLEEDYIVILSDGTELEVYLEENSNTHDLALLKVRERARCPVIPVSQQQNLNQGQKLFTVGSPIGIKHVVTAGIFSGYTRVGEEDMLQTDAPINPGNSGGPLIDENGHIVGINTSIARKSEGIGFAIPIGVALTEFGL